jgi:hypothetical protein
MARAFGPRLYDLTGATYRDAMADSPRVVQPNQPRAADLEAWSTRPWVDGVQIEDLQPLDVLAVRTRNTLYQITIISGQTGAVMVAGGRFFPEPTRAVLAGASLGGSFLKRHGIYLGFMMEVLHESQCIVTTRVRSISKVSAGRPQ